MKLEIIGTCVFAGLASAFGPGKLRIESNDTAVDGSYVDIKDQGNVSFAGLLDKKEAKTNKTAVSALPTFEVVEGKLVMKEPQEPKIVGAIGQHNVSEIPVLSFVPTDYPQEVLFNHKNTTHLTAMGMENWYVCNTDENGNIVGFYLLNQYPDKSLDCKPARLVLA
ncbi:hypothetical protein TRICI_003916 [Trichomonascus ciferrii]|uniref:Uncharacterized protein n=1 Tax=Trichomonascus ciferrii TaxID=44093 RepID=A0A642V2M5_9ASCO|nr:hypothetical protein TRICI_003916 [Trichomonascus ciferrii]